MRYFIRQGDTLSQIAQSHGVSVDAIMAVNPQIHDRDKIIAGDMIELPDGRVPLWHAIRDALFGRR